MVSQNGGTHNPRQPVANVFITDDGRRPVASSKRLLSPDSPAKLPPPIPLFPLAVPAERGGTKDSGLISLDIGVSNNSGGTPA